MKRQSSSLTVLFILVFALLAPHANAAIKPGGACKKFGETVVDSGFKYKCIKSGKKLIWDKGLKIISSNAQNKVDPNTDSIAWPSNSAKYITALPVDLTQINSISKYASCSGHNRDGYTFEKVLTSNLSLKHYLYPVEMFQGTTDKVKVFAPFDGSVASIQLEADKKGAGRPMNGNGLGLSTPIDPNAIFLFGHVYFTKNFKVGEPVKAGQLLGYASMSDPGFDFDIDLIGKSRAANGAEVLGSIFDHMSKSVLDSFAEFGISPALMKISISDRQKEPCDFNSGDGRTTADWVALKGQTIKIKSTSPQNDSGNSGNTSKPSETQKPNTSNDSSGPVFQQPGQSCDPKKESSGKAADGTQLVCKAGSNGTNSWQAK